VVDFGESVFFAGKAAKQAHSGATQLFGQRRQRKKEAAQSDQLLFTHS
jgi:hypothetical protein